MPELDEQDFVSFLAMLQGGTMREMWPDDKIENYSTLVKVFWN